MKTVSLTEIVATLQNEYTNIGCSSLYFFYSGLDSKNRRFCHQVISGLPFFIVKTATHSDGIYVSILSRWDAEFSDKHNEDMDGWNKIQGSRRQLANKVFGSMLLPNVCSMANYTWGFEITTKSGLQAHIIKPLYLDLSKNNGFFIENNVLNFDTLFNGQMNWTIPLKTIYEKTNEMTPLSSWQINNSDKDSQSEDELESIFGCKADTSKIMDMGERNFNIDVD